MTIAIGLLANDGIVLCADTQYTVSGFIKTYDGKVDVDIFREPFLAFAMAGAGSSDYIQTAKQELFGDFPETCKSVRGLKAILKQRWLNFFNEHLSPWAAFPENERPTVELLIAATRHKMYPRMYHCNGTAFHETSQMAIGSGILLADALLRRHCFGNYTVSQLASLAVYIISKVKDGVDGCGGSTHVMAVRKGWDFALTEDKDVAALEARFTELEKESDQKLTKTITEMPVPLSWHTEYKKRAQSETTSLNAQKSNRTDSGARLKTLPGGASAPKKPQK